MPRWWNLVDTQDLKSCNHCGCKGSNPFRGTFKKLIDTKNQITYIKY